MSRYFTDREVETVRAWYVARAGRNAELSSLSILMARPRSSISRLARRLGLTSQHRKLPRKPRTKYATSAERRRAIGNATRTRIAERGHPRGASGIRRTEEHTEKLLAGAARWRQEAPQQQLERARRQMVETRIATHGTAGPPLKGTRAFSRAKSGARPDLGGQFFRSRWEANYARYLNLLVQTGQVTRWSYESKTFRFVGISRGTMTYTPDFEVERPSGAVEYHEVKGWMDPKSKTRMDRMVRYHPTVRVVLVDNRVYRDIERKLAGAIPGWEGRDR